MTRRTPTGVWLVMLCLATSTRAAFFAQRWFARHKRKANAMTERKALSAAESAAMQRTADRLIRQVSDLQLKHGELSAWAVHKTPGSDWVGEPAEKHVGKFFDFSCNGFGSTYVWPQSIDWKTKPIRLFDAVCHGLIGLLNTQSPRLPDSLIDWLRGNPNQTLGRWVWFAAGFETTPLPLHEPRTCRKCWASDGEGFFDVATVESGQKPWVDYYRRVMPPNADCWLVKIDNLLQTTIEAVEYLAALPAVVESSTSGTTATNGEAIADAKPDAVPELTIPQCADVPPNERTFAHLFFEVSCTETDNSIADEKDSKGHWRGAHQFRRFSERRRADYPKWPGVERLRLEIESTGDAFNRAALVKWRARQCLAVGIDTDTLNATKLVDIATGLENPRSGKTEAKKPEADSVPAVDGTSGTKKPEAVAAESTKVRQSWREAYELHRYAESKKEKPLTVGESYEYLKNHGIDENREELRSYKLPPRKNYVTYVSKARNALGEPAYTPRAGREKTSGSIRKQSEI